MASTTSKVGLILLTFHSQLLDRGGLEGVNVLRFAAKLDDLGREFVVLCVELDITTERATNNTRNRIETATMQGIVSARSPGESTDGDDESQAAMDRALEIFGELEEQLVDDHQVNETALDMYISRAEHKYFTDGLNRIYEIRFTVTIETQLN